MSWQTILGLTVLGALVSTAGSLVAIVIKDFFFARSMENWKSTRELRNVYKKFRDPLFLATVELLRRFNEIVYESAGDFLDAKYLTPHAPRPGNNSADISDPYYLRYKLLSTIYRLCAWLGWLELYRREVTFLDSGEHSTNAQFEVLLWSARGTLADGWLNGAPDWPTWQDSLIFREEQRAIGEAMIDATGKTVIGFGGFCERFFSAQSSLGGPWLQIAANYLIGLSISGSQNRRDFRRARCMLFMDHGVALLQCLSQERVESWQNNLRNRALQDLKQFQIKVPNKAWRMSL